MPPIRTLLPVLLLLPLSLYPQQPNYPQRGQRGYVPPPIPREQNRTPAVEDPHATAAARMALYETEFSLDAFEKEVMKNMLTAYEESKNKILIAKNMEYPDKLNAIKTEQKKLTNELKIFLTEEELGRFSELHFTDKKRERKKRKKNKGKG